MNEQLQDLLKKVYDEGVNKANAEAEEIISRANAEAEATVSKAKAEAEKLISSAKAEAEALKKNTEADLIMASNHFTSVLKQKISEMVMQVTVQDSTKQAFEDISFVQSLIEEALAAWKEDSAQLSIAGDLANKLDEAFLSSVRATYNKELKIDFSPKIKAGFSISPVDGSYKLSFTDEDFSALFTNYLRPRSAKILFKD